jgi:hypothetical protein
MPDLVYDTPIGVRVHIEYDQWMQHIRKHEEVTIEDAASALVTPIRICAHRTTPKRQVYEGAPRGRGFFPENFPQVFVELLDDQTGRVKTVFLSTRPYIGRQLWP